MDRFSVLPDFIIHHIMSYLSAKEVAQSCVLSKRWNCLQRSFPILDFNQNYFLEEEVTRRSFSSRRHDKGFRKRIENFMKFVDVSLLQFCQFGLSMQKFRLFISLLDVEKTSPLVDKWIGLAVEHHVKELHAEVLTVIDGKQYTLPRTIFSAKFVTTLKLVGCKFEQLQPFDTIRFYSLKELTLSRVCINEQMVQKLTSECPLLEDLSFFHCSGFKRLCVSKPLKLKTMKVVAISDTEPQLESVEIAVTSLQLLNIMFDKARKRRAQVIKIAGCPHLSELNLRGVKFTTDQEFQGFISKLPLLEYFDLSSCYLPERVMISGYHLKHLQLRHCDNLKALEVDTPNLLSFSYQSDQIPSPCSINAPCPWIVHSIPEVELYTQWCLNLRKFLGLSCEIEDLIVPIRQNMRSFNLEEFRESCHSLPCQVGNLYLTIIPPSDYTASAYMILLDGLLSVCYPQSLSVQTVWEEQPKLFKWFYDELKKIRDPKCCNSPHIKCWRHYLKDVHVVVESFFQEIGWKWINLDDLTELLKVDSLMDVWPILPPRTILQFHLNWCYPDPLLEGLGDLPAMR